MRQQVTPYLSFKGTAKEALALYTEIFEGEIVEIQTYGEANFSTSPEAEQLILHAKFKKDDLCLMISDVFPGQSYEIGNNVSLVLEIDSETEIQKIYKQLLQRGSVIMELQDTFWGAKYAKVQDAFGIIWDLNYTKKSSNE